MKIFVDYLMIPLLGTSISSFGVFFAATIVNSMRDEEDKVTLKEEFIATVVFSGILFVLIFLAMFVPPIMFFVRFLILLVLWFCFRPVSLFEFIALLFLWVLFMFLLAISGLGEYFVHLILPMDAGFGGGIDISPE